MLFFLGMRRFNLVEHERRSWGFTGLALDLLTAPVYVAAAAAQLAGRPLQYVVTAKGSAATGDSWRTFRPHLFWLGVAAASVLAGLALHHDYPTLYVWALLTIVVCGAAPLHVAAQRIAEALPVRLARVRSVLRNRRVGDALVARRPADQPPAARAARPAGDPGRRLAAARRPRRGRGLSQRGRARRGAAPHRAAVPSSPPPPEQAQRPGTQRRRGGSPDGVGWCVLVLKVWS